MKHESDSLNAMDNMNPGPDLNLLLSGKPVEDKTVPEGDFNFRVRKDGTACFDWFRNPYDESFIVPEILEVPGSVGGYPVVSVLPFFWEEFCEIRRIILPDSITGFERNPFENCLNLKEITVSQDHPFLAFENGLLLDRIQKRVICCPAGTDAEEIRIPEWITSIGKGAFSNCSRIHSVVLPDGITDIGEGAFSDCIRLEQIRVPSGVQEITEFVFNNCSALKQVHLSEGIRKIGDFAFASCTELTSLHLPDSIESFGCYVFTVCEKLETINIPQSLKEIDLPPFVHCNRLKNVIVHPLQETYSLEGSLLINRLLREVVCCIPAMQEEESVIPNGIRRIGSCAFSDIPWLRDITVPEGVESIGDGAFEGCKELRQVHLPDSLKVLEDYVFIGCYKLEQINLPRSIQLFGHLCLCWEENLQAALEINSAAEDYCRQYQIPYRYTE